MPKPCSICDKPLMTRQVVTAGGANIDVFFCRTCDRRRCATCGHHEQNSGTPKCSNCGKHF